MKAIIVKQGMGGFLCPPTHPEHTMSVETDICRRPENRGSCSLSYCAEEATWIDPAVRKRAKQILDDWNKAKPALSSPEVQDWIHQVLGYFHDCYQGNPDLGDKAWHAGNLTIDKKRDPLDFVDVHAGVRFIRKYYPEFLPTKEHFDKAYWGTKPE